MKIKKKVQSCDELNVQAILEPDQGQIPQESCPYSAAIDSIKLAIESLAEIAKDDEVAKDSIANLGVILLDLKGSCK